MFQNLDVNLAVNNLLSRDDDDPDDQDESGDTYMPPGRLLYSCLIRSCTQDLTNFLILNKGILKTKSSS